MLTKHNSETTIKLRVEEGKKSVYRREMRAEERRGDGSRRRKRDGSIKES